MESRYELRRSHYKEGVEDETKDTEREDVNRQREQRDDGANEGIDDTEYHCEEDEGGEAVKGDAVQELRSYGYCDDVHYEMDQYFDGIHDPRIANRGVLELFGLLCYIIHRCQ